MDIHHQADTGPLLFDRGASPAPRDAILLEQLAIRGRPAQAAIAELYDRYSSPVYSLSLALAPDVASAHTLAESVFVHLYRSAVHPAASQPFPTLPLRSWLLHVTCHLARQSQQTFSRGSASERRGHAALRYLPIAAQFLIALLRFGGYSIEEVATLTNRSEEAVQEDLHNAMRLFRTQLTAHL